MEAEKQQKAAGFICLQGGAEFGGRMADSDRRALQLAGGGDAPVCIIPAAAAPDRNHQRAGQNGVRWFGSLGARNVALLALIDRPSAARPEIVAALESARMVYMLGGFTHYLGQTLAGSPAWQAMRAAHQNGAVIAGSSAGAMVLCQVYFNPEAGEIVDGLGLVPRTCVIPHHDTFGRGWAGKLAKLLPGVALLGIDEQTGVIDDGPGRAWRVYGKGAATLYQDGNVSRFVPGETFALR